MSSIDKLHTGRLLRAAAVWLLCALVGLAAAAVAAGHLRWGAEAAMRLTAPVIALATAAACIVLLRGRKGKGRLMAALLTALVIAALLLTLGFLILPEGPSLPGLLRIVLSAALGACLGAAPGRGRKADKTRPRFGRAGG